MKNLIFSQDNSIDPNGVIGLQKCGIVFWQKAGLLKHCNESLFQSIISLINKKFSPTNIQNYGDTCFLKFDNDDNRTIYLSLKKGRNSNHYFIYGESHTVYANAEFHLFSLDVVSYISKQIGCEFYVDDATGFLEHHSVDKLKQYIASFVIPNVESPDLFRQAIIDKQNQE